MRSTFGLLLLAAYATAIPSPQATYPPPTNMCAQLFTAGNQLLFQVASGTGTYLMYSPKANGVVVPGHTLIDEFLFAEPQCANSVWQVGLKPTPPAGQAQQYALRSTDNRFLAFCGAAQSAVEADPNQYDTNAITGQYARLEFKESDKTVWEFNIIIDTATQCRIVIENCALGKQLGVCPAAQCPKATGSITDSPVVVGFTNNQVQFDVTCANPTPAPPPPPAYTPPPPPPPPAYTPPPPPPQGSAYGAPPPPQGSAYGAPPPGNYS